MYNSNTKFAACNGIKSKSKAASAILRIRMLLHVYEFIRMQSQKMAETHKVLCCNHSCKACLSERSYEAIDPLLHCRFMVVSSTVTCLTIVTAPLHFHFGISKFTIMMRTIAQH